MSEEREDANWDKAQRSHRDIQEEILHSRNLELFEDVERLLPGPELPECLEQLMPVDQWDPEDQKLKRKLPSASKEICHVYFEGWIMGILKVETHYYCCSGKFTT